MQRYTYATSPHNNHTNRYVLVMRKTHTKIDVGLQTVAHNVRSGIAGNITWRGVGSAMCMISSVTMPTNICPTNCLSTWRILVNGTLVYSTPIVWAGAGLYRWTETMARVCITDISVAQ